MPDSDESQLGSAASKITHIEFTPKLPIQNTTVDIDKRDRDVAAKYQKFLKEGYWFLWEGDTAIPGGTFLYIQDILLSCSNQVLRWQWSRAFRI
jgi:hypothetical protein